MSEGPIKWEREAHKPKIISTPDAKRVCADSSGRGYCGRATPPAKRANRWDAVTCTDCRAAYRADGGRIELLPGARA